jgi:hypothetical protein
MISNSAVQCHLSSFKGHQLQNDTPKEKRLTAQEQPLIFRRNEKDILVFFLKQNMLFQEYSICVCARACAFP